MTCVRSLICQRGDFVDILDDNGNLQPVPVKLLNLLQGGKQVNSQAGITSLSGVQLTRRFFLIDRISTQPAAGGDPLLVRVPASITLWYFRV